MQSYFQNNQITIADQNLITLINMLRSQNQFQIQPYANYVNPYPLQQLPTLILKQQKKNSYNFNPIIFNIRQKQLIFQNFQCSQRYAQAQAPQPVSKLQLINQQANLVQQLQQKSLQPLNQMCFLYEHLKNQLLIQQSKSQVLTNIAQTFLTTQQDVPDKDNMQNMQIQTDNIQYQPSQSSNQYQNTPISQKSNVQEQIEAEGISNLLDNQIIENKQIKEYLKVKNLSCCNHIEIPKPKAEQQSMSSMTNQHRNTSACIQSLRNESTFDPQTYRKMCIERYKNKKRQWLKKVSYQCRKETADKRLRVKGRFISKSDQDNIYELIKKENVGDILNANKNLDIPKVQAKIKLFAAKNPKKISKEKILDTINQKVHLHQINRQLVKRIQKKKQILQIIVVPR